MSAPRIVLASASPRRVDLLRGAGWDFEVMVSGAEEAEYHGEGPGFLALENARRKWSAIAASRPDDLVIAADTVVWMEGEFFAKPHDMAHACQMVSALAGRTHSVVTGVVIGNRSCPAVEFAETTLVTFRNLSPEEIEDYLREIEPLDKAGAYAAQGEGGRIISEIRGLKSNVIGLPIERVSGYLESLGLKPQRRQV
ncbi:MAG: Maf family protein [Terrimicrobiaceae bacterium]